VKWLLRTTAKEKMTQPDVVALALVVRAQKSTEAKLFHLPVLVPQKPPLLGAITGFDQWHRRDPGTQDFWVPGSLLYVPHMCHCATGQNLLWHPKVGVSAVRRITTRSCHA